MIKGGWNKINDILKPLHMRRLTTRNHDLEGFMEWMKVRIRSSKFIHNFYLPEDVIRNVSEF